MTSCKPPRRAVSASEACPTMHMACSDTFEDDYSTLLSATVLEAPAEALLSLEEAVSQMAVELGSYSAVDAACVSKLFRALAHPVATPLRPEAVCPEPVVQRAGLDWLANLLAKADTSMLPEEDLIHQANFKSVFVLYARLASTP